MRKLILIFFYLTIPVYIFCQQITPEVIVSSGNYIKVQITNPEGLKILFEMSDVNGRVLLNYKTIDISGIQELDLQNYIPGIYLLRVWSNDMNYSNTFLIQK